jgi:arginyl-tRNA--protein-N-Asp/Glu arginylyltransferase
LETNSGYKLFKKYHLPKNKNHGKRNKSRKEFSVKSAT